MARAGSQKGIAQCIEVLLRKASVAIVTTWALCWRSMKHKHPETGRNVQMYSMYVWTAPHVVLTRPPGSKIVPKAHTRGRIALRVAKAESGALGPVCPHIRALARPVRACSLHDRDDPNLAAVQRFETWHSGRSDDSDPGYFSRTASRMPFSPLRKGACAYEMLHRPWHV
jgi:hypothetical protein